MQLQFSTRNHTDFNDLYRAVTGKNDYEPPSYADPKHIEVVDPFGFLSSEQDDDCISVETETQYKKTNNKIDS